MIWKLRNRRCDIWIEFRFLSYAYGRARVAMTAGLIPRIVGCDGCESFGSGAAVFFVASFWNFEIVCDLEIAFVIFWNRDGDGVWLYSVLLSWCHQWDVRCQSVSQVKWYVCCYEARNIEMELVRLWVRCEWCVAVGGWCLPSVCPFSKFPSQSKYSFSNSMMMERCFICILESLST